jgi:hypothetical protein
MPETGGEGTPRNEMSHILHSRITDFTCVILYAMLLQQVLFGLDAILDQEPAEEFDLGGSTTFPDELVELTVSSCRDHHSIQSRGAELSVASFHGHHPTSPSLVRPTPSTREERPTYVFLRRSS